MAIPRILDPPAARRPHSRRASCRPIPGMWHVREHGPLQARKDKPRTPARHGASTAVRITRKKIYVSMLPFTGGRPAASTDKGAHPAKTARYPMKKDHG